jgi:hypothetical protein
MSFSKNRKIEARINNSLKLVFFLCLPICGASFSADIWHTSSDSFRDGLSVEPSTSLHSSSCQSTPCGSSEIFGGSATAAAAASGPLYFPAVEGLSCSSCGNVPIRLGEPGPERTWTAFFCHSCGSNRNDLIRIKGKCLVCTRRATFGLTLQRPRHCKQHMAGGEVDLLNKRCHVEGCGRQPSFGNASVGVAVSCAAHKHDSFINLKGRLCRHPEGCTKTACFGFEGGMPLFCADHKTSRHVGLSQRPRCQSSGCDMHPKYGDATARIIMFCKMHKRASDVDLRKVRCQNAEGCDNWARYGDTTSQPKFCFDHHSDGQVRDSSRNLVSMRA